MSNSLPTGSQPGADPFQVRATLPTPEGPAVIYDLHKLQDQGLVKLSRLPYSIRVLLENLLRHLDGRVVRTEHVLAVTRWGQNSLQPQQEAGVHNSEDNQIIRHTEATAGAQDIQEIPFFPARVLLQDFTGVPAVVDLAALRSAVARRGGDPQRVNPLIPVDLVIDHSVQVDVAGSADAFTRNVQLEFERNRERYTLFRWAQQAFRNFRVVPPGTGIVHQVNSEYLASVVQLRPEQGELRLFPDTVVGTDSHTTMINGLGVLGWGVGGIEAEAVMLGEPYFFALPEVVGVALTGHLPEGATATDLVLTITQLLRRVGVVGRFVEFFGPAVRELQLPDRLTIANMAPEYGATAGFFPPDEETLAYLRLTGRPEEQVCLVEEYTRRQELFRTATAPDPEYTSVVELDLSTVEPSLAGPRHPQDRVPLAQVKSNFQALLTGVGRTPSLEPAASTRPTPTNPRATAHVPPGQGRELPDSAKRSHVADLPGGMGLTDRAELSEGTGLTDRPGLSEGAVVIAAITSCTNTANPAVMLAAGLLARKAVERGLTTRPWVKASLAPGSRVVTDYLQKAGLMPYLEALRFHLVGYGCTTCIGNSGPLDPAVAQQVKEQELVVAAVLSGNRNFEGRINPLVKANYLASPPLVVAYALAGRMDIDLTTEPLAYDPAGRPVYLRDLWPTQQEVAQTLATTITAEMFRQRYAHVFDGDELWQSLPAPTGILYHWDPASTYIQEPPFLDSSRSPFVNSSGGSSLGPVHDSPLDSSPCSSPHVSSPGSSHLSSRGLSHVSSRGLSHVSSLGLSHVSSGLSHVSSPGSSQGSGVGSSPDSPMKSATTSGGCFHLERARVLAMLGDSVTTDHISPAGTIPRESPAGQYLIAHGVTPAHFNSYGSRRGNHEVMVRGTFANIRLRNRLAPGTEGGWTVHLPDGETMTMYEAAQRYQAEGVPLIVLAGKEYGTGSSRDWAAKGPYLLGVRAVIAESFERIHRSNLVGMGILPLQFLPGQNAGTLGLDGTEEYDIKPATPVPNADRIVPRQEFVVTARRTTGHRIADRSASPSDGNEGRSDTIQFTVVARLDTPIEVQYALAGGILPYVLDQVLARSE
ncbi:MAG: aconitate hydratase [Limnochordaceae bacterium]|nr:aconitate hydratase [Limnochordaceae bacterium]